MGRVHVYLAAQIFTHPHSALSLYSIYMPLT